MELITNLINGPCYTLGMLIWSFCMNAIMGIVTTTPQDFSSEAWIYVSGTLYPWALGMGIAMLNIFFLIGFFREASNLRENMTWEILITYFIKAIIANGVMLKGMTLIKEFFSVSARLAGDVILSSAPSFTTTDVDGGSYLFFFVFGVIYVLVAIVCGGMMLLTVYGRYLKLYIMTVLSPIALSTWAGGRGIENSAGAWIRTFLANVFEIVAIAIVIAIANRMISSIDFGQLESTLGSMVDGFGGALQSMFTMILMTGAVKGADSLMHKAFAL